MSEERFVTVQFCDDIRQEVGNKLSLIGCYSGEMIFNELPVLVPKVAAWVRLVTPISRPFERITVRAYLGDQLIGELQAGDGVRLSPQDKTRSDATRMSVVMVMIFSPLAVEKESILRVEADTESGVLIGDTLRLRKRGENDPLSPVF